MSTYKELTQENCKDFKDFSYGEFRCKCGGKYCNGYPVAFSYDLVSNLQKIRDYFGKPLVITSPLRCKQHNKNSGGVSDSRHLKGWACDFYINGVSAGTLINYVKKLPYFRYTYNVSGGVIHYDITPPTTGENTYTGTLPTLPSRGYFKKGDKGTQVKNLQNFLNWAVNSNLVVDGIIGNATINAVKQFQKEVKIYVDGLFGKDCLSKAKAYTK